MKLKQYAAVVLALLTFTADALRLDNRSNTSHHVSSSGNATGQSKQAPTFQEYVAPLADALRLDNSSNTSHHLHSSGNATGQTKQAPTFQSYYGLHTGRGMWKWGPALDAYQRHFGPWSPYPCKLLEIGVQSGGSIPMYHAVLPQSHYYGMDINKNCVWFQDPTTTIYIGDQASVPAWTHFFAAVVPTLDLVIDDGGHQAHQMLATIQQVLPHMSAGGFFFTEDIHGQNDDYLTKFFHPAADAIAWHAYNGGVSSVHLYPFMLGVQMAGGTPAVSPGVPVATVATLDALMATLPLHPGAVVEFASPAAALLTADSLKNAFSAFYGLHGGAVREEPLECHDTTASYCAMIATNTEQQNLIKAVHISPASILVEVNAAAPQIRADRKGETWIPYNGP